MKQRHIAVLGITLAMSSTAPWATQPDARQRSYMDPNRVERPAAEAAATRPQASLDEEERAAAAASHQFIPIVPREYAAPESREYAAPGSGTGPVQQPHYDPRHPQTGQLIERGLFNRSGPNDFGA